MIVPKFTQQVSVQVISFKDGLFLPIQRSRVPTISSDLLLTTKFHELGLLLWFWFWFILYVRIIVPEGTSLVAHWLRIRLPI